MTPLTIQKRSFLLDLLRPVFLYFRKRYSPYFEKIASPLRDHPYLSGMISRFNSLHETIFVPTFNKVRVDTHEIEKLKTLSQDHTLVYIMKNRGQLEYSFFNHLFLKEGIPLARFANGARTIFWRPFREIFDLFFARINRYYEKGPKPNPITSGYLEGLIAQGESVLLNLKVSREFVFGTSEDAVAFIPPLLRAAQKSKKPVLLITQQFLHDRRPSKSRKSIVDLLFGEKTNPGPVRKLILFLMSYRHKATVKFGEPLDLKKFLAENKKDSPSEWVNKLKNLLVNRLEVEQKSITGPTLKPREYFLDKIIEDPFFLKKLEAIGQSEKMRFDILQEKTRKIFYEIAADMNYTYIDLYDKLVHWLLNRVYDGLDIDTAGLAKIKEIAGSHPVILVPSHKSHVDYLLLSYVFYNYDLTLPHICAGINLKFWPVGGLMRKGGGFFIRRSIRGNELYKIVLQHYLKALVTEGFAVEFFIEGTRSRTGKILKPRTGILAMVIQSYLEGTLSRGTLSQGGTNDIYFVPISINYERIMEEKSYAQEIRGGEKEKENAGSLLRASQKIRKKQGRVSIQFADPLSLKDYLEEKNLDFIEDASNTLRQEIDQFASRLTYNINKVSVVTSTSLVVTSCLGYPRRGIPEEAVFERCSFLKKYLDYKGVRFSQVVRQNELRACQEALLRLTQDGLISQHHDFSETFYTIGEAHRSLLDYHKNNIIHFFVSLVCFLKIVVRWRDSNAGPEIPLDQMEKKYETLKSLFAFEFTFSERTELRLHLEKIITFLEDEEFLEYDQVAKKIRLSPHAVNDRCFLFYLGLLDHFFESYWLTLRYLKQVPGTRMERKKLVNAILGYGKILYLKGDVAFAESLSRFNVENALLSFEQMGLMEGLADAESIDQWLELLSQLAGSSSSSSASSSLSSSSSEASSSAVI